MSIHLDRAHLLYSQSRYDLAENELRRALAAEPGDAEAHALLALCLNHREEYAEATREAEQAVGLAPYAAFSHYALAVVLGDRNCLKEAEAGIDEALQLDPSEPMYYGVLASIRYNQRRWQEALDTAEQGLELDAEHDGCTNLRAIALVKLGRRREAGATIGDAFARDPENPLTHANQGWALLEQGKPEEALGHFREALRLEPELEWARMGVVESLKARYRVYRLMLLFFLWMSKLSARAQWGVVIGLFLLQRVLATLADANPAVAPFVTPVLIAYSAFIVLTWTADPLFCLLLRLNRFGRLVLSREQTVASNWLGGCLLLALLALVAGLAVDEPALVLAALVLGLMLIPTAGTFRAPAGWPRRLLMLYTAVLAVVGLSGPALFFEAANQPREVAKDLIETAKTCLSLFVIGCLCFSLVANGLAMHRPGR